MGVGEQVAALTNEAMDGTMALGESLEQRLNLLNCTPADIKRFLEKHPPKSRLVPVRAPRHAVPSLLSSAHAHLVAWPWPCTCRTTHWCLGAVADALCVACAGH